ncbi:hypothetical protein EI94DRAFT_1804468 [Lactarius quietus]|nr:hypothetical protein EI94DRAFT_1804468 [Lactarius quietus]
MVPVYSIFSSSKTQGAPSEVQSALDILEKSLFVRAKDLFDEVSIATKDTKGTINWIMLNSKYHSVLVRSTIAAVKANGPRHSIASIKEALFILLLDILNGRTRQDFFSQAGQEEANIVKETQRKMTKTLQTGKKVPDREEQYHLHTPPTPHLQSLTPIPPPPPSPEEPCTRISHPTQTQISPPEDPTPAQLEEMFKIVEGDLDLRDDKECKDLLGGGPAAPATRDKEGNPARTVNTSRTT